MPIDDVPPIDADQTTSNQSNARETLEYEVLQLGAALQLLQKRELSQKLRLRWIAVIVGLTVVVGMAAMLAHFLHNIFVGPFVFVSSALSVALVLAPIASITSVTIALFIGAFRRFEDKDANSAANGIATGMSMFRGG